MPTYDPTLSEVERSPFKNCFLNYITDKCTHHTYADIYDYYLATRRQTFRGVLELGIFRGGSLYGWREYFPNANVYGLDNNKSFIFNDERITSILGDSSIPSDLISLGETYGPFDLIVDDAGHDPRSQIIALINLWQYLSPGGVYAIEDLVIPWETHPADSFFANFPGTIYDGRQQSRIPNDIILVLEKEK